MEKQIIEVFKYFDFFDYSPTKEEIYCFLKKKASFGRFLGIFENMVEKGVVTRISNSQFPILSQFSIFNKQYINQPRYTVGEYGIKKTQSSKLKAQNYLSKQDNSINKLNGLRFKIYIKIIKFFPQIRLVGLSGSISMLNAARNDDIDLFIITAENRLYTARFVTLLFAQLLGLRRKRDSATQFLSHESLTSSSTGPLESEKIALASSSKDKVCLNLFFDEKNLSIPSSKRSEYVAHEVLQMKPIMDKNNTYEKFLQANLWVKKIFPNSYLVFSMKYKVSKKRILNTKYFILDTFGAWVELILKNLQLKLINRHKTNEIITNTQLWFHPEDFGKKLCSINS